MNLADSPMDCLRGCLATLSVLVVRISLLDHSKIHEKAYKCIVYEFGGFQNVNKFHQKRNEETIHL